MKFRHVGIPTEVEQTGEICLPTYKLCCPDDQRNPFGIQMHALRVRLLIAGVGQEQAHVAFEVHDLANALKSHEILIEPNGSPSEWGSGGFPGVPWRTQGVHRVAAKRRDSCSATRISCWLPKLGHRHPSTHFR